MAVTLNVVHSRNSVYSVSPYDIEVREDLRGRFTPPTEEQIIELASSIVKEGQLQPVQCRKTPGGGLLLTLGFTRLAAIRLIRDGFTIPDEDNEGGERVVHFPDFKISTTIVTGTDTESFIANVVENQMRNQTSPIDDAHNQRRMRRDFGMSDKEIAEKYRCSTAKVQRTARLVELSRDHQLMVHAGTLTVNAAIDLLDMPEPERPAVVKTATKDNGRVDSTVVRQQVRDHHLSDDNKPPVTPTEPAVKPASAPVSKARSLTELKEFLTAETLTGSPKSQKVSTAILEFMAGKTTSDSFKETWDKVTG